jgi:hypothetical protein
MPGLELSALALQNDPSYARAAGPFEFVLQNNRVTPELP